MLEKFIYQCQFIAKILRIVLTDDLVSNLSKNGLQLDILFSTDIYWSCIL